LLLLALGEPSHLFANAFDQRDHQFELFRELSDGLFAKGGKGLSFSVDHGPLTALGVEEKIHFRISPQTMNPGSATLDFQLLLDWGPRLFKSVFKDRGGKALAVEATEQSRKANNKAAWSVFHGTLRLRGGPFGPMVVWKSISWNALPLEGDLDSGMHDHAHHSHDGHDHRQGHEPASGRGAKSD